jgi:nucleoside-diphosphate-sugar epimerase
LKNIILTGSSGFIGLNLKTYLQEQGHHVNSLSLRGKDWKKKLNNISGDVLIHLAGKAHDTKRTSASEEYFAVNLDLTVSLFEDFLQSEIRDFFYFSSVKAIADTLDVVLEENTEANPQTPYGQSKWLAEQYLRSKMLPEGKRVFIFRPSMVHGPGNKGNLNLLYKLVSKGIPWPLATFDNQRSFLSIENLQFMIKHIVDDEKIPDGVYNLVDDEPLSTNSLITLMSEVLGRKPRLWKIPIGLITRVAKVGDILHLPLNSERLKKLTENFIVSNQKIKEALGINQLPLSASEGLRKTLVSFKRQKKNDSFF